MSSQKSAQQSFTKAADSKCSNTMREQSSPGDFIDKTWPKDSLYPFGCPIIQGTVNQNQSFLFQKERKFVLLARTRLQIRDSRDEQITKDFSFSWLISNNATSAFDRPPRVNSSLYVGFRLLFLPKQDCKSDLELGLTMVKKCAEDLKLNTGSVLFNNR